MVDLSVLQFSSLVALRIVLGECVVQADNSKSFFTNLKSPIHIK